jgi:hypothetical protein
MPQGCCGQTQQQIKMTTTASTTPGTTTTATTNKQHINYASYISCKRAQAVRGPSAESIAGARTV